jgi:hypothetical protein
MIREVTFTTSPGDRWGMTALFKIAVRGFAPLLAIAFPFSAVFAIRINPNYYIFT